MDQEAGRVISVTRDKLVIEMESCEACETCKAKHACTALIDESERTIEIPILADMPELRQGDRVELTFRPESRIFSAFIMFIFPLILMIAGYFIGFRLFQREGMAILVSLIALVLSLGVIWVINRSLLRNSKFIPSIHRIEQ
ncbi:SoxR reducing system RseC family protein [candidate division KSB1 bacterium]|nr:SoxR reducing system RseC family protein [candidate division KSB1 bacterium]